ELGIFDQVVVATTVRQSRGHCGGHLGGVVAPLLGADGFPALVHLGVLFGGEVPSHSTVERVSGLSVHGYRLVGRVGLDRFADARCDLCTSLLVQVHWLSPAILRPRASAAARTSCRRCCVSWSLAALTLSRSRRWSCSNTR